MNLKTMSVTCCMAFAAGAAFAEIDSMDKALDLTNVSFSQDMATRDIVVNYEITGSPAFIQADVLTNGVSIGCAKAFVGDYSYT